MLRLDDAITCYHQALSLKSTDNFCRDMLERAMDEHFRAARPPAAGRSSYASTMTMRSADASSARAGGRHSPGGDGMAVDGAGFMSPSQLPHRSAALLPVQDGVLEDSPS